MSGFSLSLSGLQSTINNLKDVENDITKEIDAEIGAGVEKMRKSAVRLVPVDKGFLKGKISASRVSYLTYELVAQSDYAAYVEFGTKEYADKYIATLAQDVKRYAGQFKGGSGSVPWRIIKKWCERKEIPKEKWWFIYLQIKEKGMKPSPYFFPSVYAYRPEIVKNIVKILREKR